MNEVCKLGQIECLGEIVVLEHPRQQGESQPDIQGMMSPPQCPRGLSLERCLHNALCVYCSLHSCLLCMYLSSPIFCLSSRKVPSVLQVPSVPTLVRPD